LSGSVNYGQSLHGFHNTKSLRTPALDYGLTDIEKGENAKGCSWCTTLKALKVGRAGDT